jgi:GTPase SAR1 family protein
MGECLVLGPECAGKTLLIRKLEGLCSKKKGKGSDGKLTEGLDTASLASQACNYTVPTVGANFAQLKPAKGVLCKLRESGGQMVSLWSKAYEDCRMVIYVIDSSNRVQVSASTILFLDMLSSPPLQDKPVLLFFNKTDLPLGLGLVQYKKVMRLGDILAHATQKVTVIDGSCWTGEGIEGVLEWLVEHTK